MKRGRDIWIIRTRKTNTCPEWVCLQIPDILHSLSVRQDEAAVDPPINLQTNIHTFYIHKPHERPNLERH